MSSMIGNSWFRRSVIGRSAVLGLLLAWGAVSVNCGTTREGIDGREPGATIAANMCTGEDCGPPLPDDEPEDPPEDPAPEPPQPDPEKIRHVVIPADFVESSLNLALAGTVVQLSHTSGELLEYPRMVEQCTPKSGADTSDCQEACADVPIKLKASCLEQCTENQGSVCSWVCSSASTHSFVRWGAVTKGFSTTQVCNATTCPACNPEELVPSLKDIPFALPYLYFEPLPSWHITCSVNPIRFEGTGFNLTAATLPNRLVLRFPGTASSPAITCSGAPDPGIDDLAFKITFDLPHATLAAQVPAEGEIEGDFSSGAGPIVDWVADLDGRVKNAVKDGTHEILNRQSTRKTYRQLFTDLTKDFARVHHLDAVDHVDLLESDSDGLHVQYMTP